MSSGTAEPDVAPAPASTPTPTGGELLSVEQLERHARYLAEIHTVSPDPRRARPLSPRLDAAATDLEAIFQKVAAVERRDQQTVPSEEWLRDNYHIVQDQIREIRHDLPRGFYLELPKLASGPDAGYPRVFALASEIITHSEGRLDAETLTRITDAYQSVAALSIGEVWAIPIMLRLGLVEHLARLGEEAMRVREDREEARKWAAQSLTNIERPASSLWRRLEWRPSVPERLSPALVAELLHCLRDQPPSAAPLWGWLHTQLATLGTSPEEMIRLEQQREAARQLAIANVIGSMRLLSSLEWPIFFERVSLVERVLRGDPVGAYAQMDFATRDRYRRSVEELAKRSRKDEVFVARQAIDRASRAKRTDPATEHRHHVGYYLISEGRFALEHDLNYPVRLRERFARFASRHPAIGYLGCIGVLFGLSIASLLVYAHRHGGSIFDLVLVAAIVLIPVSDLAVNLVNRLLTAQIPPRPLPKLAMLDGIPAGARTMVVVPTILSTEEGIHHLLEELEVRYSANRDANLHFALLGDFGDASAETLPDDERLIVEATRGIATLNERYSKEKFFFFHRARRWNAAEGVWMGWERKRGKLREFNRLLRGATNTSFVVQVGDLSLLPGVKYVITLDSDTQLPMDAARRLVGTLDHPLNRPHVDADRRLVTDGYGILQPRVEVNVISANRTTFAHTFSGRVGLDPYTNAVSDVYQDLFQEGNYVGKGIYDVDAFETTLDGRVPDDSLLSHDLFEGFFARVGLCTDIHLFDDYPSHYLSWAARQHRWVRGDWQIVRWLWRTVPDGSGSLVPNTLPLIARWKILDNLRRSLLTPALVLLLVAGWLVLPGSPLLWTTIVALVLAFPAYIQLGHSLTTRMRGVPLGAHLRAQRADISASARQALLMTVFLVHQAYLTLDAVIRTLARVFVTRRHLLEWTSAAEVALTLRNDWIATVRRLWPASVTAAMLVVLVLAVAPGKLWWALPILALWVAAPAFAYRTGLPQDRPVGALTTSEQIVLRRVARRTWRFFEECVTPADHWLVPDNYQENRKERIASRTSPTNVGLQLLSTVAAHQFGYLSVSELVTLLEETCATLAGLPRYRGHLYNWYDTRSLKPLAPSYLSTVDSGNLVGCLLTLKQALNELTDSEPVISWRFVEGLDTAASIVEEELDRLEISTNRRSPAASRLRHEIDVLHQRLLWHPPAVSGWLWFLRDLADRIASLTLLLGEIEEDLHDLPASETALEEIRFYLERSLRSIDHRHEELVGLAPWVGMIRPDSDGADRGSTDRAMVEPASVLSLADLIAWCEQGLTIGEDVGGDIDARLFEALGRSRRTAADLVERIERLIVVADALIDETDFNFLFDSQRQLFSIGYSVTEGRLDVSHYDTLASEARLASFVAIAMGKVPSTHWFKLGRALTPAGRSRVLLSWSASMFEYLMPLLVTRAYPDTLLGETYQAVVERQIDYASERSVPWGISESGYNVQDLDQNYQYKAFGVPGLGIKRGLADDLVISPYASILAAPLRPHEVVLNLQRLADEGAIGRLGCYEAIDYTEERLPPGTSRVVLPTFMAHHQGMILISLVNCLHGNSMPSYFHSEPRVQAAELLLHERVADLVPLKPPPIERVAEIRTMRSLPPPTVRRYTTPQTPGPRANLLSNGSYNVMLTNAGSGFSARRGVALTRWREDVAEERWGTFFYLRDLQTGRFWSTAYQPTCTQPDDYEVTFSADRAVFRRRDDDIEVHTEVAVSPEDDAELRRVSIVNHGADTRDLDVTSYAEVVLLPPEADVAHPAFHNLFVETSAPSGRDALIAMRRPRLDDPSACLVHVLAGRGRLAGVSEFETDRSRFIGRGRSVRAPRAMTSSDPLSGSTGAVLDPIVSLRRRVRLAPGVTARLSFTTAFADTEGGAHALIEKYEDRRAVARGLALAGTHSLIELRHLGLTADTAQLIQRLAARLIFADPRLRAPDAIRANRLSQRELWKHGISGDRPILLARVAELDHVPLVRDLLKAHEYCWLKGCEFDLVLLNEHATSYRQDVQEELQRVIEAGPSGAWVDRPGGVFLRRGDLLSNEDRTLLQAAARIIVSGSRGSLHEQLRVPQVPFELPPALEAPAAKPTSSSRDASEQQAQPIDADLVHFNGFGGFTRDGRDYVIRLAPGQSVPAPWSNVVANPRFGFLVSERGAGFTWSENSYENRLTPWSNDPVSDPPGETLFVRDEENGSFWPTTPLSGDSAYTVRHGQGYSTFEHLRHDIVSELALFVPADDPVKIWRLRLQNRSRRPRRLSATMWVDWVLGVSRSSSRPHIVTYEEPATRSILAVNAFRNVFAERVAFLAVNRDGHTLTADRIEFLGRHGTPLEPRALGRSHLSGRTGSNLDPCGAIQVSVPLGPGETGEVVFLLGEGLDEAHARTLILRYRDTARVQAAWNAVRDEWGRLLETVQVSTPDPAMDLLLNRWLLYQTVSCRFWGRSAFYQSSGAFGFRDQLQDVLALILSSPETVRAHILHAATRQYVEGDVQHWWHEPTGQGVRTRCSDDRLWLPFATAEYVAATGETAILDEHVPFLEGRRLEAGELEALERPVRSTEQAPLFDHCVRAIDLSLETGAHGLPLIGTGDWNDGMNRVGHGGQGESVWLGWFLQVVLGPFADLAEKRGDASRAVRYRAHAATLLKACEDAWDGGWYRRAYFDDGSPLGSASNDECRIDSVAQSWAALSGNADPGRVGLAMEAVDRQLVRRDERLIELLTPPFDRSRPNPGYIQGYVPGVRENGGQYTHGALWVVAAAARLGAGDQAFELFSLLNPLKRTETSDQVLHYKVEPYVVAADVYSAPAHRGRGGWTWYTGSAGWMYRIGLSTLLGLSLKDGKLQIDPCIPRQWPGYRMTFRSGGTEYVIDVENPSGVCQGVERLELDGVAITTSEIPNVREKGRHRIRVVLGRRTP